ncbi:MAG TPA: hypothetical protein VFG68_16650 [Fimbriiglobus sp.]|nr:hypothetical protein [Fimbriiglobus sp.]
MGLEADTVTAEPANNLRISVRSAGAKSGAVGAGPTAWQPPSPLLTEVMALVQRLDPADRARLAEVLNEGEGV